MIATGEQHCKLLGPLQNSTWPLNPSPSPLVEGSSIPRVLMPAPMRMRVPDGATGRSLPHSMKLAYRSQPLDRR